MQYVIPVICLLLGICLAIAAAMDNDPFDVFEPWDPLDPMRDP